MGWSQEDARSVEEAFDRALKNPLFRRRVRELRRILYTPGLFTRAGVAEAFNNILRYLGYGPVPPEVFSALDPPLPRGSYGTSRCTPADPLSYVKVVWVPAIEAERGVRLLEAHACTHVGGFFDGMAEVTLVFSDEKPPAGDERFLVWRLAAWGRVEDLETVIVSGKGVYYAEGRIVPRGLPGVRRAYPPLSRDNYWTTGHGTGFEDAQPPITLYVNTWNHGLSTRDGNPGLVKTPHPLSELPRGGLSRLELENLLSRIGLEDFHFIPPVERGA